jgi:hypothetical protein
MKDPSLILNPIYTYIFFMGQFFLEYFKIQKKDNEIVAALKKLPASKLHLKKTKNFNHCIFFQIFMIRYGSLNIDIGSTVKVIAKPGDIVNIPPMTPYTLRNKVNIFWIFTYFSYSSFKISAELGYDLWFVITAMVTGWKLALGAKFSLFFARYRKFRC